MPYDKSKDVYAGYAEGATNQARQADALTPNDTGDQYYKALYVGQAGDLAIIPMEQQNDTPVIVLKNHPIGYVPIMVRRVMATGTTAGLIVGLKD